MSGERTCAMCGGRDVVRRWEGRSSARDSVDSVSFRPSSERYGTTSGTVVRCRSCGHATLADLPSRHDVTSAYAHVADEVSLHERDGQVATAVAGLARLEAAVEPGRLLDVGCWTGALVEAAGQRGWEARGIEPSAWAVEQARERGLDVTVGDIHALEGADGVYRAITICDVLEHLEDPDAAMRLLVGQLEPAGALYITVPDAGSALARLLGRRWWSVLPMHLHYFTRASMLLLLARHGLRPVSTRTHAKTFSARYYAERLAGYSEAIGRVAASALERAGFSDRPMAPDFRDRMEVIAVRR